MRTFGHDELRQPSAPSIFDFSIVQYLDYFSAIAEVLIEVQYEGIKPRFLRFPTVSLLQRLSLAVGIPVRELQPSPPPVPGS